MNNRPTRMLSFPLAITICLLASGPSFGGVVGGSGGFLMGINSLSMSGFSTHLEENGYPGLSRAFVELGCGAHAFVKTAVLTLEGGGFFGNGASNGRYDISLSGGHGFHHVGVIVYERQNLMVYPLVGLGVAGYRLKVTDYEAGTMRDFTSTSVIADVALAAEHIFAQESDRRSNVGVIFGFRVGYTFSVATNHWQAERNGSFMPTVPFPKLGMTGPYLRLYLGGGWLQMDTYDAGL